MFAHDGASRDHDRARSSQQQGCCSFVEGEADPLAALTTFAEAEAAELE
jgi:hypothetical protein